MGHGAPRGAMEQSIGRAGARGMKLLAQISLGSGSRSAAKLQLLSGELSDGVGADYLSRAQLAAGQGDVFDEGDGIY